MLVGRAFDFEAGDVFDTDKAVFFGIHNVPMAVAIDRQTGALLWKTRLDEGAMRRAAATLVGEHDFTSFETAPSTRRSSVRTIHRLDLLGNLAVQAAPDAELQVGLDGREERLEHRRVVAMGGAQFRRHVIALQQSNM